jgi:hypothetical protein
MSDGQRGGITEAAQAISKLGAAKGGKERAARLSPDERRAIAKQAAIARWDKTLPKAARPVKATHGSPDRPLRIGTLEIPCYVLEDGRRVLVQRGMMTALDMKQGTAGRGAGDRLAKFIAGKSVGPFVSDKLAHVITSPIIFQPPTGGTAYGYEATILADLCDAVLTARKEGKLNYQQKHIAEQCEILVRGFARVGIIALVDEATGYQADRARDELNKILKAYISKELLPWTQRFPDEFFKQIYRLRNWQYKEGSHKRPRIVGKLIKNLIYRPLPPGVLPELEKRNPPDEKGYRKHRHHQFLTTETGHPHLDRQLVEVTALMRVSETREEFERLFKRAFPKRNEQLDLSYGTIAEEESEDEEVMV